MSKPVVQTGLSARHPLSLLALTIAALLTGTSAAHDRQQPADELFALSLDELMNVQVTGAAVRDLGLSEQAETGNPFHWSILDIAASVETIDHNTMQARSLNNVIEAAENLVGVLSGDSPAEPHSFSMRGFSRDSVNVLHDGISMGIASLNTRPQPTFNLAQLEITKGAATLQHGQGAAAGSINFITRKPLIGSRQVSEAIVEYGSHASQQLSLGVSGPVNTDSAYRIDLSHQQSDGWVDDASSRALTLTGGLRWQPRQDLELGVSLNYLDDELPAYWGTPLVPRALARDPVSGVVDTDDDRVIDADTIGNNYNVADHEIGSESLWTRVDLQYDLDPHSHVHASVYRFNAERDWRNAENYRFNADTGVVERDRFLVQHDRRLNGLRAGYIRLGDWLGRANRFALTVEWSVNDFERDIGFDVDNPEPFVDTVDLYDPVPGSFGAVDIRPDGVRTEIQALVLENALALTEQLRLDLAIRQEWIGLDRWRRNFNGEFISRTLLDKTFEQQAYRVGLLHKLSPKLSVYGHVGEQHDPFESDIANVFFANSFKPSDVRQYEIGLKSLLADDRIELTAAWFDIHKHQRVQRSDASFINNEQDSQGLELALRAQLTDDVRLGGNLAYTDTAYQQFYDAVIDANVDGNRPVNAPEHMASLWASINRIAELPIELGAGLYYVSERFADSPNRITLERYTLINAFVAYAQDRYRLAFNVRNVSDEIYAPWSDTTYPNQIALGAPRSYELSLQLKF